MTIKSEDFIMTKRWTIILFALLMPFASFAAESLAPENLNQRSLFDKINQGDISEFIIYKSYNSEVDATATDKDGTLYVVKRPYNYEEDDFFIDYLKLKDIPLTILDEAYQGPLPEDTENNKSYMVIAYLMYAIPIILILALILMVRTISRQSKVIEKLTNALTEKQASE